MTEKAPHSAAEYSGTELEDMALLENYHRWILGEFRAFFGSNVAEIGAGMGSFSKLILETRVKSLTAFEPSSNMFSLLHESLADETRAVAVNDCFGEQYAHSRYDSVIYVNVLEHIEDDRTELRYAHAGLKEKGHLLLFVPALPWLFSDFDAEIGHFRRYLKGDLVDLVISAGFDIVRACYFDIAGILPWYFNFVLLKNTPGRGSVAFYDNFIVPPMRRIESAFTPPVGKNILLVARKA